LILSGSQTDFPVVDDKVVVGLLTRSDVLTALSRHSQETLISGIMRRDFEAIEINEGLEQALVRLQTSGYQTLPVTSRGYLVGLVTVDNISEFLMIRSTLRQSRGFEPA
jgi:predicted transcriptional regulator